MKRFAIAGSVMAILVGVSGLEAQEAPQMPTPQQEHQWLQQLVGEWDVKGKAQMGPDQPPVECHGTETIRSIGGFWIMSELQSTMLGTPVTGILTLGYDPQSQKYVGTWIDSMTSTLWKYEGTLDEDAKTLTLLTEGPNPTDPGKRVKYKEVLELKSKDHKVFSSSIQGEDGEWVTFVTFHGHRKK